MRARGKPYEGSRCDCLIVTDGVRALFSIGDCIQELNPIRELGEIPSLLVTLIQSRLDNACSIEVREDEVTIVIGILFNPFEVHRKLL